MSIRFRFSSISITGFRGIRDLTIDLPPSMPTYFVGPNNAGKSTVLAAIAFALKGGGFHTFSPAVTDFFHEPDNTSVDSFTVDLRLDAADGSLPAVQGVGSPVYVHGIRVLGRKTKTGRLEHRHVLLDESGSAILYSPRTPLKAAAKLEFKDHNLGWARYYARLDDIRRDMPDVWLLTPENLNRSLYSWKTGPLNKLAKLLSDQFLKSEWSFEYEDQVRKMPSSLESAHKFFRSCVTEFPFWKDDLKPKLETALGTYLGKSMTFGLQPDILQLEEWLQQQLAVSFAAEDGGAAMPLPSMGDGWQALVRLAVLEVLQTYTATSNDQVVLLCEEPEAYLHPHLRRKLRTVLASLSDKGWLVVSATHATEFISFNEPQLIIRLWRNDTSTSRGQLATSDVEEGAKLQARLDERGNHELVLANKIVVCEGKDDVFALKTYLERTTTDLDALGVTILDVGGCGNEPIYARMANALGIPWCALTDEDLLPDGSIQLSTVEARTQLEVERTEHDFSPFWPGSLEQSLRLEGRKATPGWQIENLRPLSFDGLNEQYPDFVATIESIRTWIEH